MKRKLFSTLLFSLFLVSALNADCYTEWLNAFESATNEFNSDLERCGSALSEKRCSKEADLGYSLALDQATDQYINCVYGK